MPGERMPFLEEYREQNNQASLEAWLDNPSIGVFFKSTPRSYLISWLPAKEASVEEKIHQLEEEIRDYDRASWWRQGWRWLWNDISKKRQIIHHYQEIVHPSLEAWLDSPSIGFCFKSTPRSYLISCLPAKEDSIEKKMHQLEAEIRAYDQASWWRQGWRWLWKGISKKRQLISRYQEIDRQEQGSRIVMYPEEIKSIDDYGAHQSVAVAFFQSISCSQEEANLLQLAAEQIEEIKLMQQALWINDRLQVELLAQQANQLQSHSTQLEEHAAQLEEQGKEIAELKRMMEEREKERKEKKERKERKKREKREREEREKREQREEGGQQPLPSPMTDLPATAIGHVFPTHHPSIATQNMFTENARRVEVAAFADTVALPPALSAVSNLK
jgi:hypothetical protein